MAKVKTPQTFTVKYMFVFFYFMYENIWRCQVLILVT